MAIITYGTSPAALTLAAMLARKGLETIVVTERQPLAGCYHYRLLGNKSFHPYPWFWDANGGTLGLVMDRLQRPAAMAPSTATPTAMVRLPGEDVVLPLNRGGFEDALARLFPDQANRLSDFLDTLQELAGDFVRLATTPGLPSWNLARHYRTRYLTYLQSCFSSPGLIQVLAALVPQPSVTTAEMAGFLAGQVLIWQPLPDGLTGLVQFCQDCLDGLTIVPERIVRVTTDDGCIRSVVLDSGQQLTCDWLISAYDDYVTARNLSFPPSSLPPDSPPGVPREFLYLLLPRAYAGRIADHALTAIYPPYPDGPLPSLSVFNPARVDSHVDAGSDLALTLWQPPGRNEPWDRLLARTFPGLDPVTVLCEQINSSQLEALIGVRNGDIHYWISGAGRFLRPGVPRSLGLTNLICLGEFGCAWFFASLVALNRVLRVGSA